MTLTIQERSIIRTIYKLRRPLLAFWPGHSRGARRPLVVERKVDRTLVTAADRLSDQTIRQALWREFPEIPILSEELESSHVVASDTLWIIDPLDGTQAFVDGSRDFAILVSLRVMGVPKFSVVYYPVVQEMVVAKNLRLVAPPGSTPAICRTRRFPQRFFIQTAYCDLGSLFAAAADRIDCQVSLDESTRVLLEVAKGKLDGAVVLVCGHKIWDVAALDHILRAGRCILTDETGRPLQYATVSVTVMYLVAARSRSLHELLLMRLTRAGQCYPGQGAQIESG